MAACTQARACFILGIDRKSTRLNSSHTVISYAVFCLKKKKARQYLNQQATSIRLIVIHPNIAHRPGLSVFFFFNDTAPTEIYTLSLHDALPIYALVKAGVGRVVAAMQDPNPEVAGRGLKRLADAGIAVHSGVLEGEARALNQGFLKRMEHGLPFVRVKLAMSLDGRTAMESGESQWITGPAARSAVQRLRAQASVVLTGADTVLADNARLTVRAAELGLDAEQTASAMSRPPLRVLIDGRLRVPLDAPFFKAGPALVATCMAIEEQYANGPECLIVAGDDGLVDLRKLLVELAHRGVNEVLVEAGPRLAGAFAQQGLVDEFQIFIAGKFLGSSARPLLDWPLAQMKDAPELKIIEIRAVGDDWRVIAIPVPAA